MNKLRGARLVLFNEIAGRDGWGNNSGDCSRDRRHTVRRGANS